LSPIFFVGEGGGDYPGCPGIFSGVHFSSPQKLTTFFLFQSSLRLGLHETHQNSVIKIWQLIGRPLAAGTTGTMANPALLLI